MHAYPAVWHGPLQEIGMQCFGDLLTVTGGHLELVATQNSTVSSPVLDEPTLLQGTGYECDRRTLGA
ncbi:hypothetical protein ACPOL_6851 (plasmid) [Acidisarcina polymorpha]|uniref:Uncharacterized protein n=1 Tax=Acidisarcina polymorpha TaxID=2211140 RepID=A0A2Z5GAN3_9BACT|nr:hypothetical protein ACPOL_6851 [Acidisarcina polymorpha]